MRKSTFSDHGNLSTALQEFVRVIDVRCMNENPIHSQDCTAAAALQICNSFRNYDGIVYPSMAGEAIHVMSLVTGTSGSGNQGHWT
jgi:hypothetical protein